MRSKTILQITGMISTKYGAIERYMLYMNDYCARLGYKTFLQYESVPWSQAYLDDLARSQANLLIRPVNIAETVSRIRNVQNLLSTTRPDIVHVHFAEPSVRVTMAILGRINGARRIICTVHNKPDWSKRRAASITYNMYDYVLPVSNSVGESLMAGGVLKSRIHMHYLGIMGKRTKSAEAGKAIREKYKIPANAVLLATIAFEAPFKGLDLLIPALSRVAVKRRDIHWMSIGVDPKESKLPEMASALGIADRVHWVGIIDDGCALLDAADIYVQPSRSSEGLPLAIMEAMAIRIPILCTRISGNIEAVEDLKSGKVVDPDADSLSNGILWMAENPQLWEEMGSHAYRKYLELFEGKSSVENMVRRFYL